MSLVEEAFEACVLLDKKTVADGYGGYITTYTDGAEFDAACVIMGSSQIIAAQMKGTNATYMITTKRAMNLQYHDVFRRLRDGKVFRVTRDGDDYVAPLSAGPTIRNMRQVEAEEWVIPNE